VQLLVGPANPERLNATKTAWKSFADAVPGALHGLSPDFQVYTVSDVAGGRAEAVPRIGPRHERYEHVWIALGDGFFASGQSEQTLTLLHESAHVFCYLGPLRNRTIGSIEIWRAERDRRMNAMDETKFFDNRYDLAFKFRTFIDEIFAEQVVQRRVKPLAAERLSMYRNMRQDIARKDPFAPMDRELRCFGLLYEIVRNDLGALISTDAENREAFAQMATALIERLRGWANAEDLLAMRPRLNAADVDQQPYDFEPFDQMWTKVTKTPLGAQTIP
jgi:hypothetical protein